MRKLIAIGLMLGLAACASNPVSKSVVYDLENSYGIVQASAVAYTRLPYCTSSLVFACKKPKVVIQLAAYDKDARLALNALEAYARNPTNATVNLSSLINAASSAISAFTQYEMQQGVK